MEANRNTKIIEEIKRLSEYVPVEPPQKRTYISDAEYRGLISMAYRRALSSNDATIWINGAFGFEASKVHILCQLSSGHRPPQFVGEKHNYIRFEVGDLTFEVLNGELEICARG